MPIDKPTFRRFESAIAMKVEKASEALVGPHDDLRPEPVAAGQWLLRGEDGIEILAEAEFMLDWERLATPADDDVGIWARRSPVSTIEPAADRRAVLVTEPGEPARLMSLTVFERRFARCTEEGTIIVPLQAPLTAQYQALRAAAGDGLDVALHLADLERRRAGALEQIDENPDTALDLGFYDILANETLRDRIPDGIAMIQGVLPRAAAGHAETLSPAGVPMAVARAMAGGLNPDADVAEQWMQIRQFPTYQIEQIRALGRRIFEAFTDTALEDIQMTVAPRQIAHGYVDEVTDFVRENGRRLDDGAVPGLDAIPAHMRPDTLEVWEAAGVGFLVMADPVGRYVYAWPATPTPEARQEIDGQEPEAPAP